MKPPLLLIAGLVVFCNPAFSASLDPSSLDKAVTAIMRWSYADNDCRGSSNEQACAEREQWEKRLHSRRVFSPTPRGWSLSSDHSDQLVNRRPQLLNLVIDKVDEVHEISMAELLWVVYEHITPLCYLTVYPVLIEYTHVIDDSLCPSYLVGVQDLE